MIVWLWLQVQVHLSVPSSERRLLRTREVSQSVVVSKALPALQPAVLQQLQTEAAQLAPRAAAQVCIPSSGVNGINDLLSCV